MRSGGVFWGVWAALCLLAASSSAYAQRSGDIGIDGEDPFPLMCPDFSGSWKSDVGDHYVIQQRQCSYLKMQMSVGSTQMVLNIIPDNKIRNDHGTQVRHRWNSPDNATTLETHRVFMEEPNVRLTVVTMFEHAGNDMILQTVYTTIEDLSSPNSQPKHEYNQVILRRISADGCDSGDDNGNSGSDLKVPPVPRRKHR
jgi:hypothetical protein